MSDAYKPSHKVVPTEARLQPNRTKKPIKPLLEAHPEELDSDDSTSSKRSFTGETVSEDQQSHIEGQEVHVEPAPNADEVKTENLEIPLEFPTLITPLIIVINSSSSDEFTDTEEDITTMSPPPTLDKNIEKLSCATGTFNNEKWRTWAKRMTSFFTLHGLWIDPTKEVAQLTPEELKISEKAYHYFTFAVDDKNLELISNVNNSVEAWNILREHHFKTSIVNIVNVVRSVTSMKLQSGTMQDHVIQMQRGFNELQQLGEGLSEKLQVALLLTSLNEDYEPLVTGFQSWTDENLKVKTVGHALIDAYNRKAACHSEPSGSLSLKANDNYPRPGQQQEKRKSIQCTYCRMRNHIEADCRKKIRDNNPPSSDKGTGSGARQASDTNPSMFDLIAFQAGFVNDSSNNANGRSRKRQRQNRKQFKNEKQLKPSPEFLGNHKVTQKQSSKLTNGVVVEVKQFFPTTSYPTGSPQLKCYDHDDGDAEVTYELDNVSPSNMSLGDVSEAELEIKLSESDHLLFSPEMKNKLNENYPHSSHYSNTSANRVKHNHWIIDSGATTHMSYDSRCFQQLNQINLGRITIADGTTIPIRGKGTIVLQVRDGSESFNLKLTDCLYAPDLDTNLISVRKLVETTRNHITFEGEHCFIKSTDRSLKIGTFSKTSYLLTEYADERASPCVHDWHKRLAHRNLAEIRRLKEFGLKINKCTCNDECISCIEGKFTNQPFPQHSVKPNSCLDVIVSDLCGPMPTESIGRARYFITFTDVHSDYTEVRFLRSKSDAKSNIIEYIEHLKTSLNKKPKVFRSDRGGEFIDNELQSYFKQQGIKFECTVHDSPQQNGIAERKNRTLCDAVRTLLFGAELPPRFWAEALHNAVYTFNRIPRKERVHAPLEIFFNRIGNATFGEFGQPVFVATKQQGRKKLDKRAVKMYFMGVDDNSKGFRVWDGTLVRIERNMRFSNNKSAIDVPYQHFLREQTIPDTTETQQPTEADVHTDDSCQTPEGSIIQEPRRSARLLKSRGKTSAMASSLSSEEPEKYKQAISCKDKDKWIAAMNEELQDIEKNKTWSLVDLPKGRKSIGCKWVYKIKRNESGEAIRYKARLVAQGFSQKYGIDYDEVFAPVARSATFRILLSMAGKCQLIVRQFDVKTAFLNGDIQEEIYMRQPKGYNKGDKVLRLHKSLYGLKQAARAWNSVLHDTLISVGFKQSKADQCLYCLDVNNQVCYVIVHVDDMLFAASNQSIIDQLAAKITLKFELKDLGDVKHFLGIDVHRSSDGMFSISQENYISKVAQSTGLEDAKAQKFPIDPGYYRLEDENVLPENNEYRKIIGMLLYVSTNTRPDISASVCILAQKVEKPRELDLTEAKRIITYLHSTKSLRLHLNENMDSVTLKAFSDANWAEDRVTRKSNTGLICLVNGGTVAWSSRKQDVVSISTTEAEFYALAETAKEVQWILQILKDFNITIIEPIIIETDNQSCIKMIENEKFSNRTKHIDVRYHYLKDLVHNKKLQLKYCPTEINVADMLTKPLAGSKIKALRELAGLKNIR